jgi:hypothetical protein
VKIDLRSRAARALIDVQAVQSRVARAGIESRDVTPPDRPAGSDCYPITVELEGARLRIDVGGDYFARLLGEGGELVSVNAPALRLLADELERLPGRQSGLPRAL